MWTTVGILARIKMDISLVGTVCEGTYEWWNREFTKPQRH